MKKIFQYILMTVSMVAMASCTQDEVLTPSTEVQDIRIVVSDFPAFDDAQTRAIGTFDSGKTAWALNDVIYIVAANAGVDSQILTLTYGADGQWNADGTAIHYLSATDTHIRAIYAPNCEKEGTEIKAIDDLPFGTGEFLEKECFVENGTLTVDFTGYVRSYSRLRIVTEPNEQITVTATMFAPAGYYDSGTYDYTLTADANGNAYLYGKFAANGTVTVKNGDEVLKNYTFAAPTGEAESCVLDVRPLFVDLGLQSGTLWATRNVGADNPWDYGDYFAWGETSPKTAYTWDNYVWGTENNLTKYNSTDGKTSLEAEDDAATANMGADWSTPTDEQWGELISQCVWTWTTLNGVNGYNIVGSNGNSIFLPAAGNAERYHGTQGQYWSNILASIGENYASLANFNKNQILLGSEQGQLRNKGESVRAVKKQ